MLNASRNCIVCKTSRHPLYLHAKFKLLPVLKRIEAIKGAKLCYNCLRSHRVSVCKFSNCTICQKSHNTLLHVDDYPKVSAPNGMIIHDTSALVYIRDNRHRLIKCRALLDTGATANFISESIAKYLNVRMDTYSLSISAINGMSTESKV
ncbi:hypothetical protein ALC60_14094 [Trachymyrmex zeteki]|uniref:Peptidase A2 domain-containing protein n=1 Tax=Mycetomoellerius zeteki TaxID=64791 RepID=A0A151WGG4_9HYME|nr:hypothetical protein ALC60_14094 [Trachymyrmex zeteki]